ncbi:MAG: hypothetical protein LAT57_08815 [Balneolales bacterium]|nr:hypothetical protein [Balneolales bacterium]
MRKISILNRTDMSTMIKRSIFEPIRENLNWEEKWRQNDHGLIICWEVGRKLRDENPEIAQKVANDELPTLPWKGGLDKPTKKGLGGLKFLMQQVGFND